MSSKIARVEPGGEITLLHASKANEIIDALNMILGLTVSPESKGCVLFQPGGSKIVLKEKKEKDLPTFEGTVCVEENGEKVNKRAIFYGYIVEE